MDLKTDAWQLDAVSAGLQKCLSGPPGVAPITINERVEAQVLRRKHVELGIRPDELEEGDGEIIRSNYFDLVDADGLLERAASQPPHRSDLHALRGA